MSDQDAKDGSGSTNEGQRVPFALNLLKWPAADETIASLAGLQPSAENLLSYLLLASTEEPLEDSLGRYYELSRMDDGLVALPVHERIVRGILAPIHNAKAAYVLGHYRS